MNEQSCDVRAIQLPRWGRVAADEGVVSWLVFDGEGKVVLPVRRFLIDFTDRAPTSAPGEEPNPAADSALS